MTAKTDEYINEVGLVATSDPKVERPVYRKRGFGGTATPQQMDNAIAASLRYVRLEKRLSRAELSLLLGSMEQVYGRYERALTKLHATQVLHLCEILEVFPDDLLFDAAPHLWGSSEEEARERRRVMKLVQKLSPETLKTVGTLLDSISALQNLDT
ncbi:helix-turn-helix domain-containing protein [Rhizobium sp. 21-4511-3d]